MVIAREPPGREESRPAKERRREDEVRQRDHLERSGEGAEARAGKGSERERGMQRGQDRLIHPAFDRHALGVHGQIKARVGDAHDQQRGGEHGHAPRQRRQDDRCHQPDHRGAAEQAARAAGEQTADQRHRHHGRGGGGKQAQPQDPRAGVRVI